MGWKRSRGGLVVLAMLAWACTANGGGPPPPDGGGPPPVGPVPNLPPAQGDLQPYLEMTPAELADAIVGAPTLLDAIGASRAALARGGVAMTGIDEAFVPAVDPAASAVVSPDESINLALDARARASMGRLTLGELGQMLSDFGWPFRPGVSAGDQLVQLLQRWMRDARRDPEDPVNFAPMFISEMSKRQIPPVDVAAGSYDPNSLWLSLLELELFAAAFDRLAGPYGGSPVGSSGMAVAGAVGSHLSAAVGVLQQADPCATIVERSGNLGEAGGTPSTGALGAGLRAGLEAAGVNPARGGVYQRAMAALGTAFRMFKLRAMYNRTAVEISASNTTVHKPLEGEEKFAVFIARAGFSDDDWEAYQEQVLSHEVDRIVADCLLALGAGDDIASSIEQVGDTVQNWEIVWKVVQEPGYLVEIRKGPARNDFASSPTFGYKREWSSPSVRLQRSGKGSAETDLFLDILPEKESDHPGTEKTGKVTVSARVNLLSALPPGRSIGRWRTIWAGPGSPSGISNEIYRAWWDAIENPKLSQVLEVTYHVPDYKVDEKYPQGPSPDMTMTGVKCDGPDGDWVLDIRGSDNLRGTLSFTLAPDTLKGKFQGEMTAGDGQTHFGWHWHGWAEFRAEKEPHLILQTQGGVFTVDAPGFHVSRRVPRQQGPVPAEPGDHCS